MAGTFVVYHTHTEIGIVWRKKEEKEDELLCRKFQTEISCILSKTRSNSFLYSFNILLFIPAGLIMVCFSIQTYTRIPHLPFLVVLYIYVCVCIYIHTHTCILLF